MDEVTKLVSYDVREMPAKNLFLYNYHKSVERFNGIGDADCVEKDLVINQTGVYVFNICKCAAIVAKDRPDVILSFVMYLNSDKGPLVYYAYTKKDLRNKGFMTNLLNSLGIGRSERFMVCYTGPIPHYLRRKTIKKRVVL